MIPHARAVLLVACVVGLGLLDGCRTTRPAVMPDDIADGPLTRKGVTHTVQRGQTLWRIAKYYGVPLQELAEVNDLDDVTKIEAGQKLWIPRAQRVIDVPLAPSVAKSLEKPVEQQKPVTTAKIVPPPRKDDDDEERPPRLEVKRSRFIWPLKGRLESRFGVRDGNQHDGIDISAPKGSPIVAADGGEVIYAGQQRGYGNIVLVKHEDGLITIYAHNDDNLVKLGARVRRGQEIAKVGETGRATGPHLHFEVRQERVPRNPLFFLPERENT